MIQIQKTVRAIALRGVTILPGMSAFLDLERSASITAAKEAHANNEQVFLVSQKDSQAENPDFTQLEHVGVLATITQILRTPSGNTRILVTGQDAAELLGLPEYLPCLFAEIRTFEGAEASEARREAMCRILKEETAAYTQARGKSSKDLSDLLKSDDGFVPFTQRLSCALPLTQPDRQAYLQVCSEDEKQFEWLLSWLTNETDVENFRKDYATKVRHNLDQHQKEYILREQMKVINNELGGSESDADTYAKRLEELQCSDEIRAQIQKQITRLRTMNYGGQEVSVLQNYIETLLSMPWETRTEEMSSIGSAREILDEDHYGLTKVKEQVLEFLAVRQLNANSDGQVLLLVGPPGTGKTSIARSVARALNRTYVRISLGGVHDEAEIRGHRRTYVAAMPGRIASAIKKAGVKNPLVLLDELDKVSTDNFNGDPSSALLEVLDREQNINFTDHYLEVPLDLSEVLFMATANTLQTIPRPLLDRMEVIEIGSYTAKEKHEIAVRYLIPKQVKKSGLPEGFITFLPETVDAIISQYTREAGVRGLERQIETICRKAALRLVETSTESFLLTPAMLDDYLGQKKNRIDSAGSQPMIGVVRGLAWTAVGGDTLQIEVSTLPGKGTVALTGKMGDVMKESAQIALSYVRSIAAEYKLSEQFFESHDIHLHIPEGAVPKDGPSAGITMATAILSAVAQIPVRPDIAMTGEVTLRGRVLPIGGLKEKLLAAKAAGIREVLVPAENREDIAALEPEITEGLTITEVSQMPDVLARALVCDKDRQ